MGLASASGWVTHEAVVSGSCWDSVRVEKIVLVSASELVTWEISTHGPPGEIV